MFSISAARSSSDHEDGSPSGTWSSSARSRRRPPSRELLLAGAHVDLVVVQRVHGRGGRRGHPGAAGAGLRVADLGLVHVGEAVGRGPHALADLGPAQQAALETDVDVEVLVGLDPGLALHVVLAHDGAGQHRGVDLVAGAVEEAGVDEDDPLAGLVDAGLEVERRTPLLVHDADLDGQRGQPEQLLDAAEELDGEGHLLGAVHLGLHDVHRAGAGVGQRRRRRARRGGCRARS